VPQLTALRRAQVGVTLQNSKFSAHTTFPFIFYCSVITNLLQRGTETGAITRFSEQCHFNEE
jgi:hypothetical protein